MQNPRLNIEVPLIGYRGILVANIAYRLPDHPKVLQEFIWRHEDVSPDFPRFLRFLSFWVQKIDGPLHSVIVAHPALIEPQEILLEDKKFLLH